MSQTEVQLIKDAVIVNADVSNSAAIDVSKISGAMPSAGGTFTDDVTFTGASANIVFDKSANAFEYADNAKATFGAGNDLLIYHDGTSNIITSINGNFFLQAASGENGITINQNGAVELYYDNTKKFETTAAGGQFTGTEIKGPDNCKFVAGTSGDADFYHDGSATYLRNATGNLHIRSDNNIEFQPYSGDEVYAKFINDGAVELYHNNSKKFETTSSGVAITGGLTTSGASTINEDFSFIGASSKTITFDQSEGHIRYLDNAKAQFGTQGDLNIYHDGSHSYIQDSGTGNLRVLTNSFTVNNTLNSANLAQFTEGGSVELYFDGSKKFETTSGGSSFLDNVKWSDNKGARFGGGEDLLIFHNGSHSIINNTTGSLQIQDGGAEKFRVSGTGTSFKDDIFIANDSDKINLGAGNDLQIYHSGTASYIQSPSHTLHIQSTIIDIGNSAANEPKAKFIDDGAVELYFDAAKKLQTTSGGVTVTGTVTETSDIALKSDIQPLTNTLEKIQQITGYKYNLINSISPSMGVIAQDVEKVFPELVHGSEGKKTLQYSGLIGVLVEAVKDLSAKVAALESA